MAVQFYDPSPPPTKKNYKICHHTGPRNKPLNTKYINNHIPIQKSCDYNDKF